MRVIPELLGSFLLSPEAFLRNPGSVRYSPEPAN